MTKRAKLITALVAAIALVVVSPLVAVAYWVVNAQLAVTAKASTLSMASWAGTPAAGSSASFTGWADTEYVAVPLTNTGSTPWGRQTISVAAASGLGPAAVASVQVVFTANANACQTDATYNGVAAQSALAASTWISNAAIAPGATIYACGKLAISDTDTHTPSGQSAPSPRLTLTTTATVAQGNWTDQEQGSYTVTSTGWVSCTTDGTTAVLTLASQVTKGSYTVVRSDTGASFSANTAPNGKTLIITNTSATPSQGATYVSVKDSQGATFAIASVTFLSPAGGTKRVECA